MAGKTNSDLIREVEGFVIRLQVRWDNHERDIARLEGLLAKTTEALNDLRIGFAVLESKVNDLKTAQDEKDRRRWTIWVAVVGSVLALLANVALIVFKK